MQKLYVSPGACSMSCHIAFEEAQLKFEPLVSKWDEIVKLNPMHAVPVLVLEDGKVLSQNIAILLHIANQAPQADLLPKAGTWEYDQCVQWLSWVASDLHPAFSPLFNDQLPEDQRKAGELKVQRLLAVAEEQLAGKNFLLGNRLSVADCYLFAVYGWCKVVELPNDPYRNLNAFAARMAERPAVQTVLKREGLIK
jgi:glutathione S-transferase